MRAHAVASVFCIAAGVFFAPLSVFACTFCNSLGSNPLSLPHPKAIEVAVATRTAIEKKLLVERKLIDSESPTGARGFVALNKVPPSKLVQSWAASLEKQGSLGEPRIVHFNFIDTEQTCELIVRSGKVLFEPKPSASCDIQVVTTRVGFQALMDGTMSQKEARRLGILLVEGQADASPLVPGHLRR